MSAVASTSTLPAAMTGTAHLDPRRAWDAICLAPRNAAVAALLAYRATISPIYGDVCKYYPTCSAYAVGAVQQYGAVVGSARAAARLARCHPWAVGGVDDVPERKNFRFDLTPRGFVVPSPLRKD